MHSGRHMVQTPEPVLRGGQPLLPLPQPPTPAPGFRSSDVYWIQNIGTHRPELELKINGKKFIGLLDTGADVSVLRADQWPSMWPKTASLTQLQGIGQTCSTKQNSDLLSWIDNEGHTGLFQPYVISGLPVNLWGRDVMKDMGVYLYSPNTQVTHQMFNQGFLPNQGLGRHGQGRCEPLQYIDNQGNRGFGYF
ncbi:endogenous retrovirus group K member 7 Pro protein-like [Heterocephalus glaber]|uniref:human endogenous retrovirus K endopeptidase n=1 Tax=Heterocephalus glaber TaxID=10181 RepID=A0AAX6QMQ5_HETGA|nr:endogenous retrovirus group K member 7 Pro protein-like [Heterocephalus glaber]